MFDGDPLVPKLRLGTPLRSEVSLRMSGVLRGVSKPIPARGPLATPRSRAQRVGVQDFGKLIFILGIMLTLVGALLWKTGGLGGLGRLPGDLMIQKGNTSFYFPIVTCVVISLVLTLISWLFRR